MRHTRQPLIGGVVCIFLFSFLCNAHRKENFFEYKSTHTPDSVNLSIIRIADTNVYFTDSYGIHYQCDYSSLTKGFIKVSDSTDIWIETEGKGSPLLLIQGGPGFDHRYFHPHFSELATERTLIYTDLRGRYMSESSDSNKYNILQDINDLEDIRKKLDVRQWDILGHSFGGYIALIYAQLYPQFVKSIITVGTPLGYTDKQEEDNNIILLEKYFGDVSNITKEDNLKAMIKLAFYSNPTEDNIKYVIQAMSVYGYYDKFDAYNIHYLKNSNEVFQKHIGTNVAGKNIKELSMPLIVMIGKQDAVGYWQETEKLIKEKQPHATIHLFNKSAHFPWIEEQEEFMRIIKEWLRRQK